MSFADVVTLQLDNASPHGTSERTEKLVNRPRAKPPKIKVLHQPAMSPDTNVNDLGLYNSMNSRLRKIHPAPTTRKELKKMVREIWKALPEKILDDLYLTKKKALSGIVKVDGDNVYDLHSA